jgi:PKD repeat protein
VNDSDQCFKNHNFIFTNNSTIPVGSNTYQWQFGDSTVSLSVSPSKQYAYSNAFNIKLIAFSDHNCTDTTSKIVYVYSMPKANFLRSDTGKCLKGNQFIFTNTSQPNNAVSSQWTFGDGFGSTVKSPSHSYAAIGVYTVKLIVGGNAACSDTIQKIV